MRYLNSLKIHYYLQVNIHEFFEIKNILQFQNY